MVRGTETVSAPSRALLVEIPATPPSDLSPNARIHHMKRARLTKPLREAAYYTTLSAIHHNPEAAAAIRAATRVKVSWVVKWEPRRKTTIDRRNLGAMLKGIEDGIADALQVNDRYFDDVSIEQERDPDGFGWTCATLYPVGEDQP